jgi:hypothetical protein
MDGRRVASATPGLEQPHWRGGVPPNTIQAEGTPKEEGNASPRDPSLLPLPTQRPQESHQLRLLPRAQP